MAKCLPLFGRESSSCLEYYAILYMLLIVAQMMLDAAVFQILLNVAPEETANLYQSILIPLHCLQSTLQFFFGFDLYKAVIKRSYRRARNWRMVFFCLLAIETSIFVAYIGLASFVSVFTYVTLFALLLKVYLIWPLKLFLEECHEVCVPLAHAASTQHLLEEANKPGPSGYSGGH